MVLCGILEKVRLILKSVTKLTLSSNEKSNIPFIDERKHRQVHLQELDGEEMRKLLRVGSRVVRGPDWKWDDQVNLYFLIQMGMVIANNIQESTDKQIFNKQ